MFVQGSVIAVIFLFLYSVIGQTDFDPESHVNWNLLPKKDKCGVAKDPKIIGGKEVPLGTYPWMVLLGSTKQDRNQNYLSSPRRQFNFSCGGSLITKLYVLTAAHCLIGQHDLNNLRIRIGEHSLLSDPDCVNGVCAPPVQDIRVTKIILHKKYESMSDQNDIALIRLRSPPVLSLYVQPACLPFGLGMTINYTGLDTVVAGWGLTETGNTSSVLLDVTQKVADPRICEDQYSPLNMTFDPYYKQICVGGVIGKDSCPGDSGGPLMYKGTFDSRTRSHTYVIGLVSFGPPCGETTTPGTYTRTSYYMKWILDHLEK